ncbi:MAG: Calx-beta domain-containing protein [Pirellulaceae bacterium]
MRKQNQAGRKSRTAGRQQALSQRARRRTIFEPLEDRRMLASDALQLAYAPGTTNEYIAANPDAIAPASEADFHSDDDHVHAHVVFAPDTPQEYVDSIEDHVGHESEGDPSVASPFTLSGRWSTTASSGGGWGQGDPITLTWSIVPDGTAIPALGGISGESADPSNLVSYLGSIYGVTTANSDYTDEPWFTHFASVFDRWSEVTGITYVYEPNDDGAAFTNISSSAPGVVNVRGDVRIGGHRIDGNSGVLAYNFYPNHGDMVIDTADNFYATTGGNSIRLRDVLAHEAGHGIGLAHVESNNAGFLMEPFINTSFDGPQFDDILGAQRHYGDAYEKTLNNTVAGATPLGAVASGSTVTIGSNGTTTAVSPSANDFVSIDDEQDVDVFSFSVASASTVDLTLTPIGPTYNQGPQGGTQTSFNAAAQGNLNLELLDSNGTTVLALANVNGVGSPEAITNASLPAAGTYYARVTGTTTNAVQMYRLDVTNQTAIVPELSVNDVTVDEDAGTMTFTVQLSATVGSNVTFDYATSDASALAGSDYTAASGSATISSGSLSVPITVSILDDAVSEPTETFQLTLSNVVGVAVADGVAIGTINDDDAPALTLTIAAGSISEAAGAGATTATVTRNTGTSGPLTVNLSSSDTKAKRPRLLRWSFR